MNESQINCHDDWHEYMREWLSFDNWNVDEALLLLSGIWPIEVQIDDSPMLSPRYGSIEPPVIIHAGLLDQECNVQYRDDYERLRILAGRRLKLIRERWERGSHAGSRFPPAYFIQWAASQGTIPCWLSIWQQQAELNKQEPKSIQQSQVEQSANVKSEERSNPPTTTDQPDDELELLFDPIGTSALDKMFNCPDGTWKNFAERASRNGLAAIRGPRRKFNPFLAAQWWLKTQNPPGWDWARCLRALANNLPPRSKDKKHLLTGGYD